MTLFKQLRNWWRRKLRASSKKKSQVLAEQFLVELTVPGSKTPTAERVLKLFRKNPVRFFLMLRHDRNLLAQFQIEVVHVIKAPKLRARGYQLRIPHGRDSKIMNLWYYKYTKKSLQTFTPDVHGEGLFSISEVTLHTHRS